MSWISCSSLVQVGRVLAIRAVLHAVSTAWERLRGRAYIAIGTIRLLTMSATAHVLEREAYAVTTIGVPTAA